VEQVYQRRRTRLYTDGEETLSFSKSSQPARRLYTNFARQRETLHSLKFHHPHFQDEFKRFSKTRPNLNAQVLV
jgi:hypothetical protein